MAIHETPGPTRLRLRLPAGWISIETTDSDQTTVEVVPVSDDQATRDYAANVREELRTGPSGESLVVVEAPQQGPRFLSWLHSLQLGYRISAPRAVGVEADTASAEVRGRGCFGSV